MAAEDCRRQDLIKGFNPIKSDGHFRVDERIDCHDPLVSSPGQGIRRPRRPLGVLSDDIEDDIAVYKRDGQGLATRERQDFVSREASGGLPLHVGHQASTPPVAAAHLADADRAAGDLKCHFGCGLKPQSFPDLYRDSDLTFRGDLHYSSVS